MPPSSVRVSQACNYCRSKKRACDGHKPRCRLCDRFDIECVYAATDNRRRKRNDSSSLAATDEVAKKPAVDRSPNDIEKNGAREAIAGAKSAEMVASQLENMNDGETARKEATLAASWNLGLINSAKACSLSPLSQTMSWADFLALAAVYFAKIHPIYGTFSGEDFWNQALAAWKKDTIVTPCHEVLFFSIAALSSLFSDASPHLSSQYVELASQHLDAHLLAGNDSVQDVDGLILRTLYLRMTVGPRASWISSCTTLGLIQDLRREGGKIELRGRPVGDTNGTQLSKDLSRDERLLTASLLSAWISNESGRPKPFEPIFLHQPQLDSEKGARSPFQELLGLFSLSEIISTAKSLPETQLFEKLLKDACHFPCTHDVVKLSQANLAIVTYRILRSLMAKISTGQVADIVKVCNSSLDAARRLAEDRQPWHHVANVPFQVLCTLLLLDTKGSLSIVPLALSTIRHVAMIFDTLAMQNTLQAAQHLVTLAQRRKSEDADGLLAALSASAQEQRNDFEHGEQIAEDGMDIFGVTRWEDIDWSPLFANDTSLWEMPS